MVHPKVLQFEPKTIVNGHYEIECTIFQGEFGCVWRARNIHTDVKVALKHCIDSNLIFKEAFALFRAGDTPFCAKLFTTDHHNDEWLVAMSLEGKDVYEILHQLPDRKFSRHNMIAYCVHSINALHSLHQLEFVHKDIKVDNFALGVTNGKAPLVLLDLAFAEAFDKETRNFNVPEEKFLYCPHAPLLVLLGGKWTDGCDLFQLALSILFAAGYCYLPDCDMLTIEERAISHKHRFGNFQEELLSEDQYLIPLLTLMYNESGKTDGGIDYDAIFEALAAIEGYHPNILFELPQE